MKGKFKNLKELNSFIEPIKTIGLIVGESGFIIDFIKNDDGKVEAVIPAKHKTRGVIIHHKWNELFNDFEIEEGSVKIGFMKVQDLIGRLSIFDDDIIEVELNDSGILSFNQKNIKLDIKTSDPELIAEGKRSFGGSDWLAEFIIGDDTDKMKSALKVMSSEEFITFKGIEDKGKLQITISNQGMKTNTFKYVIDATINEDFEITFKKDLFPVILNTKGANDIVCRISQRIINMEISTDYCETKYYVAKAIIRD